MLENAGYATPPGRAACAIELARAEVKAWDDEQIRFRWEYDLEPDLSWCDCGHCETHECLVCVCEVRCGECEGWTTAAVLGGIIDAGEDYRRIVEAELALEAYDPTKSAASCH
jgi:hypothetical protein